MKRRGLSQKDLEALSQDPALGERKAGFALVSALRRRDPADRARDYAYALGWLRVAYEVYETRRPGATLGMPRAMLVAHEYRDTVRSLAFTLLELGRSDEARAVAERVLGLTDTSGAERAGTEAWPYVQASLSFCGHVVLARLAARAGRFDVVRAQLESIDCGNGTEAGFRGAYADLVLASELAAAGELDLARSFVHLYAWCCPGCGKKLAGFHELAASGKTPYLTPHRSPWLPGRWIAAAADPRR